MPGKRKLKKTVDNATKSEEESLPKVAKVEVSASAASKDGEEENTNWNWKIMSWNVDGLRACIKKDGMSIFSKEDPDILCLQETKCADSKLPPETKIPGYKSYFYAAKKDGYSGTALYSKTEPISVKYGIEYDMHDDEGRCITAEYDKFYVVTAYVPNAGKKLITLDKRMDWDGKLKKHLTDLDAKKPVIYCGDLNVAHLEIDLANPKTNKKNAGFTKEERDGFSELLKEGFFDSFRRLYPDKEAQYSFWTYMFSCRAKNVGWRLDYFVLSERLSSNLCDSQIKSSIMGSDHCPIALLMNFE